MLTRCRRGLVVVSSRNFLLGPGRSTLVGKLARERPWLESTTIAEQQANLPDARGEYAPVYYAASPTTARERPKFDVKALFQRRNPHLEVGSTEASNGGPSFSSQERDFPPLTSVQSRKSTVWDNVANTTVRTPPRQVQASYSSPSISLPQEPFDRLGTASSKIVSALSPTSYEAFPPLVSTLDTSDPSPTVRTVQQSSSIAWPRVPGHRASGMLGAQQTGENAWNTFVASRKKSSDWGYTEEYWK